MNINEAKQMDPFQVHLLDVLLRIARALEKLGEIDDEKI